MGGKTQINQTKKETKNMTGINKILQKIGLIRAAKPKPTVHISRRYLGASSHGPRMTYRR